MSIVTNSNIKFTRGEYSSETTYWENRLNISLIVPFNGSRIVTVEKFFSSLVSDKLVAVNSNSSVISPSASNFRIFIDRSCSESAPSPNRDRFFVEPQTMPLATADNTTYTHNRAMAVAGSAIYLKKEKKITNHYLGYFDYQSHSRFPLVLFSAATSIGSSSPIRVIDMTSMSMCMIANTMSWTYKRNVSTAIVTYSD